MPDVFALELNGWSLFLVAPALISFWLAGQTSRRRYGRLGNSLSVLMMAVGWWSLTYAFELANVTEAGMRFWLRAEYLAIPFVPVLMYRVIRRFLAMGRLPTSMGVLLWFVPVTTLCLHFTNESHFFFYRSITLVEDAHGVRLSLEPGVWYWIDAAYAFLVAAVALVHLAHRFPRREYKTLRIQFVFLILAVIGPYLGFSVYVFDWFPVSDLDLTPYFFFFSGLALALGIFRLQLFDLLPVAFERVFEKMRDACLVFDANDRLVMANEKAVELFDWENVPFAEPAPEVLETYERILEKFSSGSEFSGQVWEEIGGAEKILEVTVSPVEDGRGREAGRLLVLKDDTERSRMEIRTREILAERERLISIIGHDLRGSLSGLEALSSFLAEEGAGMGKAELEESLGSMRRSAATSLSLLENLLVWARIQRGEFRRAPDTFVFDEVVDEVRAQLNERLLGKEMSLELECPEKMVVKSDRRLFEVVFRNLLSNAVKFSHRGSAIRWEARQDAEGKHFVVRDEGIGIPGEMIPKLASLIERSGRHGTEGEESSGLGLVLVHEAVAELGGTVRVESEPGKGTSVFVDLPEAGPRRSGEELPS